MTSASAHPEQPLLFKTADGLELIVGTGVPPLVLGAAAALDYRFSPSIGLCGAITWAIIALALWRYGRRRAVIVSHDTVVVQGWFSRFAINYAEIAGLEYDPARPSAPDPFTPLHPPDAVKVRLTTGKVVFLPAKPPVDSGPPVLLNVLETRWRLHRSPARTRAEDMTPSSVRDAAFRSIKALSLSVTDAIADIKLEMNDVNHNAARLEPKWIEQARLKKALVDNLVREAAEQVQRVPLMLRLADAMGTDPTAARPELQAAATEQRSPAPHPTTVSRHMLYLARESLYKTAVAMWTRVLLSKAEVDLTLYPGWQIATDSGHDLRGSGRHLLNAIEAYIGLDWAAAQSHAQAGLSLVYDELSVQLTSP
jgi:hypothetical protein